MSQMIERLRPLEPRELAKRVIRAVELNRAIIVVPGWWKLFWYLERLSPRIGEALGNLLFRRTQRELEKMQSR